MSFLGILKGIGKGIGQLSGLGAGLGGASQASANNRGQKFGGQMDLATLLQQRDIENARLLAQADNDFTANQISREQEGRAGQQDAWRKLLSAQRVTNPGQMPNVSPYAAPQRQATHAELTGATALSEEVRNRLINGNPIAAIERRGSGMTFDPRTVVDPRLLDAGKGEKITGWLSAFLNGMGVTGGMRF